MTFQEYVGLKAKYDKSKKLREAKGVAVKNARQEFAPKEKRLNQVKYEMERASTLFTLKVFRGTDRLCFIWNGFDVPIWCLLSVMLVVGTCSV